MVLRDPINEQEISKSVHEAQDAAEEAGLRYVTDRIAGFSRRPFRKSFRYFDANGNPLTDPKHLNRIRLLRIPPAWTNVWICPFASGHLQVTGRDQRGRKQYLYHEEWRKTRDQNKFSRMVHFGSKLPELRRRVRADLRRHGLSREKVLAAIVSVMDQALIRVGNEEYAKTNKSYGLTTIRAQHVRVKGDRVKFHFTGKSGIVHDIELNDPRVARVIRKCQDLPGQELFTYFDDTGKLCSVSSFDVNSYLREICQEEVTAKDFRTWGGSVRALRSVLNLGPCEDGLSKAEINNVYKETAAFLGNTVAVCKKYYIHPVIAESLQAGVSIGGLTADGKVSKTALSPDEKLFLKLLKRKKASG